MNSFFLTWSCLLVLSLLASGLAIRHLAVIGIALSESLFLRGVICLLIVIAWAQYWRLSLVPKYIVTQIYRAIIAGLALTFFSMSYNWLSASTVAVLSNMDIPLLLILGSAVGQPSSLKVKVLSIISIILLVFYGLETQRQSNWVYGIGTLSMGLFLLCFGYFFIKKSMQEENRAITILTPSLALIVYGFLQKIYDNPVTMTWTQPAVWSGIVAGIGMFGAYYATMKLYSIADIATAEFPTLVASVVIQPVEWILFKERLIFSQIVLTIIFVAITYLILNFGKSEYEVSHGR